MILSKQQRKEARDTFYRNQEADRESELISQGSLAESVLEPALDTIDSLELLVSKLLQHLRVCEIPEHVLTLIVKDHFKVYGYDPYADEGYHEPS